MGKRWHKASAQFLPPDDPRIAAQDKAAAEAKAAERTAAGQRMLDLCRASETYMREQAQRIAAWEDRTGRIWGGPR